MKKHNTQKQVKGREFSPSSSRIEGMGLERNWGNMLNKVGEVEGNGFL